MWGGGGGGFNKNGFEGSEVVAGVGRWFFIKRCTYDDTLSSFSLGVTVWNTFLISGGDGVCIGTPLPHHYMTISHIARCFSNIKKLLLNMQW